MPVRPIDHIVLPCADLAKAAAAFERLGFQVGRRNRHPWGTENHIVQLSDAFLELIALAPDYRALDPAEDAFPIAGFLAGVARSSKPSGMLVLRSQSAQDDATDFARQGIGTGRRLDFSRDGVAPDGGIKTVAFSLAFAGAALMPDLGFFTCQHHFPENFWNPAAQRHPNGAIALASVVLVAENPSDHAEFLGHFSGQRHMSATSMGLEFDLPNGKLEILTPVAYAYRYGALAGWSGAPMLAALRFSVAEPAGLAGMALQKASGGLVHAADADIPVTLVFDTTAKT